MSNRASQAIWIMIAALVFSAIPLTWTASWLAIWGLIAVVVGAAIYIFWCWRFQLEQPITEVDERMTFDITPQPEYPFWRYIVDGIVGLIVIALIVFGALAFVGSTEVVKQLLSQVFG